MIFIIFLALATPSLACECGYSRVSSRIYRGKDYAPNLYPWLAAIHVKINGSNAYKLCAGSIVDKNSVVTAAHCVWDQKANAQKNPKDIFVFAGVHNFRNILGRVGVSKVILDERYGTIDSMKYDIVILKLSKNLTFSSKIVPICLPLETTDPFNELTIAGWGDINPEGSYEDYPKEGTLWYISNRECYDLKVKYYKELYPEISYNPNPVELSCAINKVMNTAACIGDSGAPLMHRTRYGQYILAGVLSGAWENCGKPNIPEMFVKVSDFKESLLRETDGCYKEW